MIFSRILLYKKECSLLEYASGSWLLLLHFKALSILGAFYFDTRLILKYSDPKLL
jgi:hypothetical protein